MSTFNDLFNTYNWDETLTSILNKTEADVLKVLGTLNAI